MAVWESSFPVDFKFPEAVPLAFSTEALTGVFQCALALMSGGRQANPAVDAWKEATLPRCGNEATMKQEAALQDVSEWRRQRHMHNPRRTVAPVRPPVTGPVAPPVIDEELYEPPGDDLSAGYVSFGDTDSLGSLGELQAVDEERTDREVSL